MADPSTAFCSPLRAFDSPLLLRERRLRLHRTGKALRLLLLFRFLLNCEVSVPASLALAETVTRTGESVKRRLEFVHQVVLGETLHQHERQRNHNVAEVYCRITAATLPSFLTTSPTPLGNSANLSFSNSSTYLAT